MISFKNSSVLLIFLRKLHHCLNNTGKMSLESVLIVTPVELEQMNKLYERTEEDVAKDVKLIQDWVKKQPHLPQGEDEHLILRSLRFNKFSVERTKQKFDYYYAARNFASEYMQDIHPLHQTIRKVHGYGCYLPLPKMTLDFERIIIFKLFNKDCPEFVSAEIIKAVMTQAEIRWKFDNQIHDVIVLDLINLNLVNTMLIRPVDVIKSYALIEKAYSDRIKGIHILNAPTYATGFIKLLKRVVSNKLGNRIHAHPNIESVYKVIPKEILPRDYGGNELPLIELQKNWVEFMESKNDWMLERAEMKSNEKLRIGTPLDIEVFGTEGTFRKINID